MVTGDGRAKVLDFGVAKVSAAGEPGTSTSEGAVIGTSAYMSPEQAEGQRVDARSDIFSFGAVLYEMVTGRRAFARDTHVDTLAAILHEEPRLLGGPMDGLIMRCLRKEPAARFQSMDDVRAQLERLGQETEGALSRPRRRRHLAAMSLAGALVLAAALGLGAWFGILRRPAAGPAAKVTTSTSHTNCLG